MLNIYNQDDASRTEFMIKEEVQLWHTLFNIKLGSESAPIWKKNEWFDYKIRIMQPILGIVSVNQSIDFESDEKWQIHGKMWKNDYIGI